MPLMSNVSEQNHMPSFVWNREPSEAFSEPYEYGGQEQFAREANAVLTELKAHYAKLDRAFARDEKTVAKAVWMLQVDALGALTDALTLTNERRHRLVSRLFRDFIETLDASLYFFHGGEKARTDLAKWYENEVIPHRVFREFIKSHHGHDKYERLRSTYSDFSKYTHRTYRALLMSYILASEDKLAYDGFRRLDPDYVLPHVVSFSYAVIAMLIKRFVEFATATDQLSKDQADALWASCLEAETVPRRFGSGPGQLMRGPLIELDFR